MTDEEAKALGTRAQALGWQWAPGTVDCNGVRVLRVCPWDATKAVVYCPGDPVAIVPIAELGAPDFRDDATRGCLLARVREAWNQPYAVALAGEFSRGVGLGRDFRSWSMRGYSPSTGEPSHLGAPGPGGEIQTIRGATEAEVLVAALEAAAVRVAR